MANELTAPTPKTYGGLQPSATVGADGFAAHEAAKVWDDGGASEAIVNKIANDIMALSPEVAAFGAEQAKQAVLEYTSKAFADMCVVQGALCFMVDCSNNEAPYAVLWRLTDVLQTAVADAENKGDEAFLQAVGRFLEQMGQTFRPPIADPARQASRAVRPGALKPPGKPVPAGSRVGGARLGAPPKSP